MVITDMQPAARDRMLDAFADYVSRRGEPVCTRYIDLGTRVIRLICHSRAFLPFVESQFACTLRDAAPHHDATLVIWQDTDMTPLAHLVCRNYSMREYARFRAEGLRRAIGRDKGAAWEFRAYDTAWSRQHPLVTIHSETGIAFAFDQRRNTYYYSVADLSPEELIKQGHLFVHTLSKILRGPDSSLGHGAVIGLNGVGVLFCGVGYRGKSTFAVNALLHGFEYVSDDYLSLGRENGSLYAWPIYSIITLSPGIWWHMRQRLRADFLSNNGRKDKYVFSIAQYHDRFVSRYPVRLCMHPCFIQGEEPSIEAGDRRIALGEFVLSSLRQTGDAEDVEAIANLYSFVSDLPCYRINLTTNLDKNTQCLRHFLEHFNA